MTTTIRSNADGSSDILNGAAEAIHIAVDGEVSLPNTPPITVPEHAFAARRLTAQFVTQGSTAIVLCDTEELDTDGGYNPATGVFQPNVAGWYFVTGMASSTQAADGTMAVSLFKNGALLGAAFTNYCATGFTASASRSCLVHMNGTTDTLDLRGRSTGNNAFLAGSEFSGFLVKAD